MSIDKYRVLLKVLETKSIQKVAKALNQAPSTVSYAIASLEDELGIPILTRSHRGVYLTAYGEEILPKVQQLISCQKEIELLAVQYRRFHSGVLHVGGSQTFLARYVTDLLTALGESCGIQAELQIRPYQEIETDLYKGNLDVAFLPKTILPDFKFIPLVENHFVFILPEDHPLAGRESATLGEVKEENIMVPDWFSHHPELNFWQELLQKEFPRDHLYSVDDVSATISLVLNHFGVGILFESILPAARDFVTCRITGVDSYPVGMMFLNTTLSPAMRTFVKFSKQYFQDKELKL